MKKKSIVAKMIVFPLLVLIMLWGAGRFLVPKWTDAVGPATPIVQGFYAEPDHSLDVLFLGSCNIFNDVDPLVLYENYGFTSYNFTSPDQELWTSYYYLKEALKTQTPEVVVLDSLMLSPHFNANESYIRQSLDYLPFSLTKLRLASVSLQDWDDYAFMSTLLPIFRYHDRWKDLNAADFQHFSQDPYNPYKGASPVYTEIEFTGDLDYMAYTDETEPLKDKAVDYLGRIKALCDEEGIELHLIKTPTALSWNYARSSAVKAVADELDIPYTDYNFHIEQMGVDWTKDALTHGGARLNAQGMEKFSLYLGADLVRLYPLPAQPADAAVAAAWDESLSHRHRDVALHGLRHQDDFMAYLKTLGAQEDCLVVITAYDDATEGLTAEHLDALKALGLAADLEDKFTWSYVAVIEDGHVRFEQAAPEEITYEGVTENGVAVSAVSAGSVVRDDTHDTHVSIELDRVEYALSHRGLNIAVYDLRAGQLVDSVSFDTYGTAAAVR